MKTSNHPRNQWPYLGDGESPGLPLGVEDVPTRKARRLTGPCEINLSGDEVAVAIIKYLESQGLEIEGPRTVRIDGDLCGKGSVYVDPAGAVLQRGEIDRAVSHFRDPFDGTLPNGVVR